MALINCKNCGCQMSDKSEACPLCGMPVGADVEEFNKAKEAATPQPSSEPAPQQNNNEEPPQPKPEQPKKKNNTGLIIGIVAGVVVILVAVLAFILLKNNKEQALAEQQAEYEMQISEQQNQIEDKLAKQVLEAYKTNTIYKIETPDFQAVQKEVDEAEDASGDLCIDWDFYYCTQDDRPDRFNVTRVDLINQNKANVYVELVFDRDVYRPKDTVVLVMIRASNEIESNWLVDDVGLGKNSIKNMMKEFTKSVLEEIDINESPDLESRFIVIDGSELRLRLGPSTSYDTFKWPDGTNRHPNVGDRFKYLGESGDFFKIDFNGNELWVSKQFSHIEESANTHSENSVPNHTNQNTNTEKATSNSTVKQETIEEGEIYVVVEEMPEFPGGEVKMMEYLAQNIKYPQMARESGIQGRVFINFVVEPDGSVSNVKVVRGIGGGCDEEAIRVVKNMPKWKPGKLKGKAVRVSYNLPINFRLT